MPKYLIERDVPGASRLSRDELRVMAQKSCAILRELGPDIQWVHSYVAGDKIYCIYNAAGPDLIREHAGCAGFPADRIVEVSGVIDPITAEG